LDPLEEPLPPPPPRPVVETAPPSRAKRRREPPPVDPEAPRRPPGGRTRSDPSNTPGKVERTPGVFPPPPPSRNPTFAGGLLTDGHDEPPDPWFPGSVLQHPADAIIADWECLAPDPPDVRPEDSVSQAGQRRPPPARHDLDVEDYRRDHGTRMSRRKDETRRNRHRSAQHDRRYVEMQQRRAPPADPPSPPPSAPSRANSDPGPPPTPAPSPPPDSPSRARRASKRRSEADGPPPLYSERTHDRRLGRSSAKSRPPPPPSAVSGPELEYPDLAELTDAPLSDPASADESQEVFLVNRLGFRGGRRGKDQRTQRPAAEAHNPLYFRCREDVTLPATNRERTAFIPVELYYRDRPVTAEELRRSCVDSRKIISLYWNFSFETKYKARGVTQWFQHNRRSDRGFPFTPGPAARIHVPKNVTVQVKAGCRLGAVAVVVDAGLDRLPEGADPPPSTHRPRNPPRPHPTDRHPRRPPAAPRAPPESYTSSPSSVSSFL
jgi:hypothetical protein